VVEEAGVPREDHGQAIGKLYIVESGAKYHKPIYNLSCMLYYSPLNATITEILLKVALNTKYSPLD
jgi:hypothetical protein